MSLTPEEKNLPLSKFESMLKTNHVYFFDSLEFEEIIQYYLELGKNSLAKKAIKLGLEQHPKSIGLNLLKAEILVLENELDKATKLLNTLKSIEPNNEEVYVQQANILSKKNEHLAAIEMLKKALVLAEDEADIYAIIGMEYLFLDNFEKARFSFAKCLEVDFEDYSSLYNVIYCFDMENKHEDAVIYLNNYINKDPYCEVAWHQLGRQYFILNDFKNALKAFDYAVLIDETFVGAYLEKAKTLEQLKQYELAIENYEATLELDDPTSFAFLRIGFCYKELQKTNMAIQYFKKAVHEDPLLDKGWIAITSCYLELKDYQKALFYVNKAIDIDELNPLYWRNYAQINLKLNQFEEAIKGFNKCLHLDDVDIVIWVGLCDTQCFIGEYDDALKTLLKANTFYHNFAEIEYRLSGLYLKFKNFDKALFHLQNAFDIDFEYQVILKELFRKEYNLKIVQKAIKDFKK
ncbi:MAG: tetratricopeptide repeat protein [Lutibacter sp.]